MGRIRRRQIHAVDVFHGIEIPQAVLTTDIGSLLLGALKPGGLIVWNVADHPKSWTVRWIVKALALEGLQSKLVSVYDDDLGNTLVVCRHTLEAVIPAQAFAAT